MMAADKERWRDAVLDDQDALLGTAKLHIAVTVVLIRPLAYDVKKRAEDPRVLR
jgi:hypothetical protein